MWCLKHYHLWSSMSALISNTLYRIAGKFGGLAIYLNNCQIKIRQNFLLAYIRVVIPYRTAKLKSANTFAMAIWDPTAKFNSHQYFRLYGIQFVALWVAHGLLDKVILYRIYYFQALSLLL